MLVFPMSLPSWVCFFIFAFLSSFFSKGLKIFGGHLHRSEHWRRNNSSMKGYLLRLVDSCGMYKALGSLPAVEGKKRITIRLGLGRWLTGHRCLLPLLTACLHPRGCTCSVDDCKLSSDVHIYAVGRTRTPTHAHYKMRTR